MEKFLTRYFEDEAFQRKWGRRFGWGIIIYTTLSILFCEWLRLTRD